MQADRQRQQCSSCTVRPRRLSRRCACRAGMSEISERALNVALLHEQTDVRREEAAWRRKQRVRRFTSNEVAHHSQTSFSISPVSCMRFDGAVAF